MKPTMALAGSALALAATLLTSCTKSGRLRPDQVFEHDLNSAATPWTHDRFDDGAGKFSLAVVSDLNGGR